MSWKFYTSRGEEKQAAFPPNGDVSFGGYRATLLADPTSGQDAATKAYVDIRALNEGAADFSATGGTYSVPNGSFGTPGWFAPITVGPNQMWEVVGTVGIQCVTAVHAVSQRMGLRDNAGAAVSGAYAFARNSLVAIVPTVINVTHTSTCIARFFTDGTVPAGTVIRLVQEFQGSGANGRLVRDGTYYQSWAWRRY
jgi:hypothetical protein